MTIRPTHFSSIFIWVLGIGFLFLWGARNVPLYTKKAQGPRPISLSAPFIVEPAPPTGGAKPPPSAEEHFTVVSHLLPAPVPTSPAPPHSVVVAVDHPASKEAGASKPNSDASPTAPLNEFTLASDAAVSLFDITVPTHRLVYLVDVSGSMLNRLEPKNPHDLRDRFQAATEEVRRSVRQLPADVSFDIVFYGEKTLAMTSTPLPATAQAKGQAENFLSRLPDDKDTGGGTDLVNGMTKALELAPDTIFLLTDGDISEAEWKLVRELHQAEEKAPVPSRLYAFGLSSEPSEEGRHLLQAIAEQSGGAYETLADWERKGAKR